MKIVGFIILVLCFNLLGLAQHLPADREQFVKEFDKLMRKSASEDLRPFIREELGKLLLETNEFPEEYFSRMIKTSNAMMDKRLKPYPEIYNYVLSVYTLVKGGQTKESYEVWHGTVDKMIDGRNVRRFKDFIEVSGAFFADGVFVINPNYEWVYEGGTYEFTYDETPFIKFKGGNLICRSFNRSRDKNAPKYSDSVVIYNTSGVYEMFRERWEGEKGKVTWEKVELPAAETFAEFERYTLSMKRTNFNCDTVMLTTPYFEQKVMGRLSDRVQIGSINEARGMEYPQFQSFQKKYEIPNFLEDVDYLGGFSLKGADFYGEGTKEEPAQLTFYRFDKPIVKTASSLVRVSEEKIDAPNCAVSLYIGLEDSIYHPGLRFTYMKKDDKLQLVRGNTGISQTPFINSHHKINMYVEEVSWKRSENEVMLDFNFATAQQQRKARFESFDYYDEQLFQKLQGMETLNPLTALWDYAYKYDKYLLPEGDAATALRRTITQAKPTLIELAALGFISYDIENEMVRINPKLEHFVKAKSGKKDYDNIVFYSDLTPQRMDGVSANDLAENEELRQQKEMMDKRNKERGQLKKFGVIDLGTLEMDLQAIDNVPISQEKSAVIFPEGNKVKLKENRSIHFTGWINAGKWEVQILEGDYNYNKNGFNIYESGVSLFRANPMKPEHGKRQIPMQSTISGVKGELLVDDVSNRCGLDEDFINFPKLSCKEKTRVFYDHKTLHKGVYDRERFYFEIEPFNLDSLATFSEEHLRLKGSLMSAGIFPKFEEELRVMPDYSLGFIRDSTKQEDGYEFYGTEARYNNKVVLSNNGLQGSGSIDFINSTSISKAFTFLPDSTVGIAEFVNRPQEEGVEFPDVNGSNAYISFQPRKNVLKARSYKEPLIFFDGEAVLYGETTIRANGMRGKGLFNLEGATLKADNYYFARHVIESDTADFNLVNQEHQKGNTSDDPFDFKTGNIKASVDFSEREAEFVFNEGSSTIIFPNNQYICKMDQFTWFMDSGDLAVEGSSEGEDLSFEQDIDLVGPNFISIHPNQDSLQFKSSKALFSSSKKIIYCTDVQYLDIADARIFPDSNQVVIRRKAKMDPLKNSKIVANYITKYHTIENATTRIDARRSYTSKGDYSYYDVDSNKYNLHLPEIGLDTSFQTTARGVIKADEGFQLSKHFDFYGDVYLKASNQFLKFDGATRIHHDCDNFEKNWMSFTAPIDPENIQIPVAEDMKDLEGNPISAGIVWRHSQDLDSINLYPAFLSSVIDNEDPIVISASGFLQFNPESEEYQIGSKEKLVNRGERGNFVSLHTSSCSLNGDGRINLGMDFGQMDVDAVGSVNYDQFSGETSMNLTLMVKAPLDKKSFENIGSKLYKIEELSPAGFNANSLEQSILEWVDRETADKIKSDYTLDNTYKKVPKEMQEAFVITDVRLEYYRRPGNDQIGFRTVTESATIVNIFGEPVMKQVPFKLFAQQRTISGDRLSFVIDIPGNYYYFFDYELNKMGTFNILTSDSELMNDIDGIKPDKRKEKKFMYQTTKSSAYMSQFARLFN